MEDFRGLKLTTPSRNTEHSKTLTFAVLALLAFIAKQIAGCTAETESVYDAPNVQGTGSVCIDYGDAGVDAASQDGGIPECEE